MFQFFKSEFFDFELIRILGSAPFGGADIAEFLEAVGQIKVNDPESWYRAWHTQGTKAEALAQDAFKTGDVVSARRAYLRSSNYFRASQYMLNDGPMFGDARVLPTVERSIDNFQRGAKLLEGDVHFLKIPYEDGYKLPGYLYLPPTSKRLPGKIPVLINSGGADSIQEELFFMYPAAGPDLGYAIITFEGPGQGIMLRREKLHMRPDWEAVTSRVIDHVYSFSAAHPELELDVDRISIAGASMGGYYALRGASDQRVKACVAIDPFYDMWDLALARMPTSVINLWLAGWVSDGLLNGICNLHSWINFQNRWEFGVAMWMFGLQSPAQCLRKMPGYTLRLEGGGEFLDRVKCPVFVSGAAHSIYFRPEISTTKIFDKLKHLRSRQKELWIPKAPEEGGLQAKCGAWGLATQKSFHFLDEQLGIQRQSPSEKT
ncbi:MAG: hypothetical protein Q9217_001176 [Psora testacea]